MPTFRLRRKGAFGLPEPVTTKPKRELIPGRNLRQSVAFGLVLAWNIVVFLVAGAILEATERFQESPYIVVVRILSISLLIISTLVFLIAR